MTPRGENFLLKVDLGDSTLEKLAELDSRGLTPVGALRRKNHLFVSLASATSTQRVAEVVGPSVPVTVEVSNLQVEQPPGTDWLVRVVGPRYPVEKSIGRLLRMCKEVSKEVGETDLVEMHVSKTEPAVLDFRISTERQIEFRTRRPSLLELGERLGVGMLVQPLSLFKKPKGLVCFDLDSTLVSEELIIEVANRAGKGEQVARITEQAMAGDLDYNRSFIHRIALLRGVSEGDLEDIWEKTRPTTEVFRLLDSLRMRGVRTAILSGAFTFFTERARERLGIDFAIGNQVDIQGGRLTGNVKGEIVDAKVKMKKMREFAAKLNLTLDEVVAVGDGANDIEIIREAGTGIAYNKGGIVKAYADGVLPDGQLVNLLFLIEG